MEYVHHRLYSFRNLRVRRLDPGQALVRRHRLRHHVRLRVRSLYRSFRSPSRLGVPSAGDRVPVGRSLPRHLDPRPHYGAHRWSHLAKFGQRLAGREDLWRRHVHRRVGHYPGIEVALHREETSQGVLRCGGGIFIKLLDMRTGKLSWYNTLQFRAGGTLVLGSSIFPRCPISLVSTTVY